jgi:DNA-directed RNA polymerase subunit RPC12/RpoP
MNEIRIKCPHCGHNIIIPKSVTHYVCICGKEYKIIIVNEQSTITSQSTGTAEGKEVSDPTINLLSPDRDQNE